MCTQMYLTFREKKRRYRNVVKGLKWPWLQRVKDASMHFAAWVALPRLARPHTGASRTARAPQCTAAVESLCRYYCLSLQLARDRRPTLSVDCRRCWLLVHLHPDAISVLVSSPRCIGEPPNLLYHTECDFRRIRQTTGLPFRPVIGTCLDFSQWAR